jgi:hypothetical protein
MISKFLTSIALTSSVFALGNGYISIKDFTQIDVYPIRCKLLQVYISKPIFEVRKIGNTVIFKLKNPLGENVSKKQLPKYLDVVFITSCGTETKIFPLRDLPATRFSIYLTNIVYSIPNRPLEDEMAELLKCYFSPECDKYPKQQGRIYGNLVIMEEYLYQNTSNATECLKEPEFCDENKGCIGVAIEKRKLQPGEVTKVWIFKMR